MLKVLLISFLISLHNVSKFLTGMGKHIKQKDVAKFSTPIEINTRRLLASASGITISHYIMYKHQISDQ